MKNKIQYWVFGVMLLICLYILYMVFGKGEPRWYETFRNDDDMPYGSEVMCDMLEVYFNDKELHIVKKPLHEVLPLNQQQYTNYVFVGMQCYLNNKSLEHLLSFVEKGNSAFFSIKTLPLRLCQRLNGVEKNDSLKQRRTPYNWNTSIFDTTATLNFTHPDLKTKKGFNYTHYYKSHSTNYNWHTIDEICPLKLENISSAIGTLDQEYINFVKVPYGNGAFFIHSTPFAFTNFSLIKNEGREYFNVVFSHLPNGDIYWDEHSKIPVHNNNNNNTLGKQNGPLNFILSYRSLRWAWYLLLTTVVFYLIFNTKRKQRIIPIAFQNVNTSLEFVKIIALLYFKQNNHKRLAEIKMKYFLNFVRNRYNITIDDEQLFINKITMKSGIPAEKILLLLKSFKMFEQSSSISADELINFHRKIEYFYNNAK